MYEHLPYKVIGPAVDASLPQLSDLVKHTFKNLGSAAGVSCKFRRFHILDLRILNP